VKKRCLDAGVEGIASTPSEFAAAMQSERRRMGKVIQAVGIQDA
jgi:tripartite-type tricarboxylate transporter receptor subunit TctC